MRLFASFLFVLCLCASSRAASLHEPKLTHAEFQIEHTTNGRRLYLRRGYPDESGYYSRTVRLTLVRDQFGRCDEVRIEREPGYTISPTSKRCSYFAPRDRDWAINAFVRETTLENETVEFARGEQIDRRSMAELLDDRRLCEPVEKRVLRWAHGDEVIVEKKR